MHEIVHEQHERGTVNNAQHTLIKGGNKTMSPAITFNIEASATQIHQQALSLAAVEQHNERTVVGSHSEDAKRQFLTKYTVHTTAR